MKFKGTVALTAAFIVIILYYFLIDVPTEERKIEEKTRSAKILLFDSDNVEAFSIARGKKTIALKRSGINEWQMTEPIDAKGDSGAVSAFLSLLDSLSFTRVVEESPNKLGTFGLDTPSLKINLLMRNRETKGIRVGDDHPMGNKIYLARLNEDRVLIAGITKDRLGLRTYDLRDKAILDFETSKVKKLECVRNEKTLTFEKLEKSWLLSEEETTAKGNENEITNFLNVIQTARIKDFVEESPKQLASYGLKNPKLLVKLTKPDTNTPLTLLIGRKGANGLYAKTLSGKNVFLIDQSLFNTINGCRLVDFMDKSLVDFKNEEVNNMTLRMVSETVDLTRDTKDSKKWTIEKPLNTQANRATVNSLLFDLKSARIVEFIETFAANLKPFGLDQPEKEITLTYKNGKTWTLALGNQTSSADHYFARRTGEEAVFTLKKSAAEAIFRPLHDLRDRTLLKFKSDEVHAILISNPKQTFVLKKFTNEWKLIQPKSINSTQGFIGNDILWVVNSLEFESTLPIDPGNALTGLNQPLLAVELLNKNSKALAHVMVGKPVANSPELHYLQVGKNPTVYTVKKRILDEIPSNINKFKVRNPTK